MSELPNNVPSVQSRPLCSKCGGHQSTHNDTRACKHCGGSGWEPAKSNAVENVESLTDEQAEALARRLLEASFWLPSLETMTNYSIVHDDHDGTNEGSVAVTIGNDADAWVSAHNPHGYGLRFRNYYGG